MPFNKQSTDWWKKAVIYQIYPKSFQDSDGDGIGDIPGIISRLNYLQDLGVNAIWLSPIFVSPQKDNGYDIADYRKINPDFGTLADFDRLVAEAGKCNIKIILDLVLNHTSDEHAWFIEARKGRNNYYHDYYVWADGEKERLPNELGAAFGGSAWTWEPTCRQYYFHQFLPQQPDLNWDNPALRQELYDLINWWTARGAGGFRLDVIDQIAKEPDKGITVNGPRLMQYLRELSDHCFQGNDLVTVGETWGADWERARAYSNPDGSIFSMVFQFQHLLLDQSGEKWDLQPLELAKLKEVINLSQTKMHGCGWNSLFWNNHDTPRIVSRWGNDTEKFREKSAQMLAMLLHGLGGTPYIYQGEELGMTNVRFDSINDYIDAETLNMFNERLEKGFDKGHIMQSVYAKSRDNARTPMQWDSSVNAGFSAGSPWLKVNQNYTVINFEAQRRSEGSVYACYKKLIALRKAYDVFAYGDFQMLAMGHPDLFAYQRHYRGKALTVFCNFREAAFTIDGELMPIGGELLMANYANIKIDFMQPYEARIYYAGT